jgi:hypothetical protein
MTRPDVIPIPLAVGSGFVALPLCTTISKTCLRLYDTKLSLLISQSSLLFPILRME